MSARLRLLLLSLIAATLLGACATGYHPTPYWMMQESQFSALVPGKATKDQVMKDIGVPLMQSFFPRQNEEVWEYRYLDGSATRMLAYVYFTPEGVYKYSYRILDPALHGDGGNNK